ncbi:HAD family hydrolase [Agarivorans sp. MS3-6]|uniref:HAD family hydrolase n=1 Tax=Agarivorans sp. TSD2052 TaxID=2937286 RepID=UPI00200CF121|nr:HAD family hydrolase [Agarivorans sp. TSD2052]UPW16727.1 haloacid dehalogenase-like hydrolase [Agarivorans sp. TSD2052]
MLSRIKLIIISISILGAFKAYADNDPLPSWNNGDTKQSIISFVNQVTDKNSPHYVPVAERIVTLDNDGTLWSEQPMYFQLYFALDRLQKLAIKDPKLAEQEPYAAALKGDIKPLLAAGDEALLYLASHTFTGMTVSEYHQMVETWVSTAKHPTKDKLFTELVYQPMIEMINYLKANDFKPYIVSGGGIEFVRPWAEKVYGIPPEQVIGSSFKTEYQMHDGKAVLIKKAELQFVNDKNMKPVAINHHIGRKPIMAFGNSDGDLAMLHWTTSDSTPSMSVYIHHTDATREWAYDRDSPIGQLDQGLIDAKQNSWPVVDMKNDWKVVYPYELKQ